MSLSSEIYAELRNFDSLQYFPHNNAASFRVQFDREIHFEGKWELALRSVSLECPTDVRNFAGQSLYVYTDIVDFSFVGGSLKQLLRRVSLGPGIHSNNNRIIFQMNGNGICCSQVYYKRITTSHCLSIRICIEDGYGKPFEFSDACVISLSLHFRRAS